MISGIHPGGEDNSMRSWLFWNEYHQARIMGKFCVNLHHHGFLPYVVPLRAPSVVGIKTLQRFVNAKHLLRPAILYLDSAHEPLETLIELGLAWRLLAPDGLLMGDDLTWDAVKQDVMRFAHLNGLVVHCYTDQWVMRKPAAGEAGPLPAGRSLALGWDGSELSIAEIRQLEETVMRRHQNAQDASTKRVRLRTRTD
ncbi:hypothetical protein HXX76_014277 [Chlamydomonas incerta]|uniref:Uncharacterized protein n=1 Tax=Chlamydomonas incerta TaxID=51695 RepID=A0A835SRQ6_CHLIN|nr:hypothetical protein HXX76_014277 [Chlamydomonas incerta]|eukprot:KAG2424701.1 hypothetical protein HXX76_014277 [Chlamydomonas incerta]